MPFALIHTDIVTWLTGGSTACEALLKLLILLGSVVATVLLLHVLVFILWKFTVNRKFYQQLKEATTLALAKEQNAAPIAEAPAAEEEDEPLSPAARAAAAEEEEATAAQPSEIEDKAAPPAMEDAAAPGEDAEPPTAPVKFIPYPATFVFPSLLLSLVSILLTGLVTNATAALAGASKAPCSTEPYGCGCTSLAWIAVSVVIVYVGVAILLLARFSSTGGLRAPTLSIATPPLISPCLNQ